MEVEQGPAVPTNGKRTPNVAIKGADGGPVQPEQAAKTQPEQPGMNTPFKTPPISEAHQSTGPAIPPGDEEARRAQKPWAKGMEDTATHSPLQRDGDQTSKDLGPSEAGHARRWVKVPKGWYAKKGNPVMDGLFIGDALGKGMQVGDTLHVFHSQAWQ